MMTFLSIRPTGHGINDLAPGLEQAHCEQSLVNKPSWSVGAGKLDPPSLPSLATTESSIGAAPGLLHIAARLLAELFALLSPKDPDAARSCGINYPLVAGETSDGGSSFRLIED